MSLQNANRPGAEEGEKVNKHGLGVDQTDPEAPGSLSPQDSERDWANHRAGLRMLGVCRTSPAALICELSPTDFRTEQPKPQNYLSKTKRNL